MEDLATFGIGENIEAAEGLRGIVEDGGDQLLEMVAEPCDPVGEEEVGVIPEGGVKGVLSFFEAEGEIELAGGVLIEEGSDAQVIEGEIGGFDVLKGEHDIEQRGAADIAVEVQLVDQAVKGIDLVFIGMGAGLTDLVEESLEGEVRQDLRAQGEGIDVEADLIFDPRDRPAGRDPGARARGCEPSHRLGDLTHGAVGRAGLR